MSSSPARTCIVRHSYYPAELNVRREAEALRDAGYSVQVICLRDEGQLSSEVVGGVSVRRLPVQHRRGSLWQYLFEYNVFFVLAAFTLLLSHLRHRYSVIQVNTMPDYLVFVALLPRLMGARVVLHVHEPVPELFRSLYPGLFSRFVAPLLSLVERVSAGFADEVLTVTDQMRELLVQRGVRADKITVILNAPDERVVIEERANDSDTTTPQPSAATIAVLTHGAIEERYGTDLIVRALAIIAKSEREIVFRLLGRGTYVNDVLALANELHLSHQVQYLGFVSHEAMLEEIRRADVCIVAMRSNEYSEVVHTNKMYEYIALRRPVVASRLRAVEAYFPDASLWYFEPDDPASLAEVILEAVDNPQAATQRVESAYRLYDQEYRWKRQMESYLAVYGRLGCARP